MQLIKVVLDTNALLRSVSRRSDFAVIMDKLYENAYQLYISNEIQLEYEEKVTDIFSKDTAELLIGAFSLLPNVKKIDVHFHLGLITIDADDSKFVDCAFAGNVHFLITDDKHFNQLKSISFPAINVISLQNFKTLLLEQ